MPYAVTPNYVTYVANYVTYAKITRNLRHFPLRNLRKLRVTYVIFPYVTYAKTSKMPYGRYATDETQRYTPLHGGISPLCYLRTLPGETDVEIGLSVARNPRKRPSPPPSMIACGVPCGRYTRVTLLYGRTAGHTKSALYSNGQPSVANIIPNWRARSAEK